MHERTRARARRYARPSAIAAKARDALVAFRLPSIILSVALFTACGEPVDTAAEQPTPSIPALAVQAITAADFVAGVPADGIVVSLHACQVDPLRCEPVAWVIIDGMLQPVGQANDYRAVWLR